MEILQNDKDSITFGTYPGLRVSVPKEMQEGSEISIHGVSQEVLDALPGELHGHGNVSWKTFHGVTFFLIR